MECEISSSRGGEYEAQNLLGCTAVFLIECRPTFQLRTRQYVPEDSDLKGMECFPNTFFAIFKYCF
jgi:hypothetical protein